MLTCPTAVTEYRSRYGNTTSTKNKSQTDRQYQSPRPQVGRGQPGTGKAYAGQDGRTRQRSVRIVRDGPRESSSGI
jgi:hypothetical protein